ncbi:MAG TPA: hypothetical protein PKH77_21275 [Anaerolineae bacterium]|nr:hypothetical protein [Anaerolineae bacterium]
MGAARAWGLSPSAWYAEPRWARAAMVAHNRLRARLDYWPGEWRQGRGLPAPEISRG